MTLFTRAIEVDPSNLSARFALATGLEKAGRAEDSLLQYEAVLAMNPGYKSARYNLAQLLRKQGRFADAAVHYHSLLSAHPGHLDARLNLANSLSALGRHAEAAIEYRTVLQSSPDNVEALNNLAWLLATSLERGVHDGPEAVRLSEKACALGGYRQATIVGTLGAAYAAAGRFEEAITTAERAITLATASGEQQVADRNTELLKEYRAGKGP